MTGPINFNPFQGISGTESLEQIQDRRKTLRFPEIDLAPVDLNMAQGHPWKKPSVERTPSLHTALTLPCRMNFPLRKTSLLQGNFYWRTL